MFYGHDTSNWSAGGVERRENWISGNSFTTRAQLTAETQHQHAVRGGGAEFHIHFSSGLWSPLSRAFIDTVCYQYLTQQAGKFNTDPKTYRHFLIQNQTKHCKPHVHFFKLLDFTGAKTKFFKKKKKKLLTGPGDVREGRRHHLHVYSKGQIAPGVKGLQPNQWTILLPNNPEQYIQTAVSSICCNSDNQGETWQGRVKSAWWSYYIPLFSFSAICTLSATWSDKNMKKKQSATIT